MLAGMPAWLITALSLLSLDLLISVMTFCSFTQWIDVSREVVTLPHFVNAYASQQGFIASQYVRVDDLAKKGQPFYEIDISRDTTTNNVSSAQTEVSKEKITNAEEVISKLSQNRQEILSSIEKQPRTNEESLKEISRLFVNALTGLRKMHNDLSGHDSCLRDGLITKDQYNYQHSLYSQ